MSIEEYPHRTVAMRLGKGFVFALLLQPVWPRALSKEGILTDEATPKSFEVEVIRAFPHEGKPFTQALEISADGKYLVEASGSYPAGTKSFVRTLDPATGKTLRSLTDGFDGMFAEGIVRMPNGNWFLSTYNDKKAVEFDKDLKLVALHEYPTEGWGLTRTIDGESFLATNGTEYVMTLQKKDFKIFDTKVATCMGKRVTGLNELEMVDNFMGLGPTLLGNVYLSRLVLALNPTTGKCIGVFHLEGLGHMENDENAGFHAANGLAYNKSSDTLIATGKNWDQMFEVRIKDDSAGKATKKLEEFLSFAKPFQAGPTDGVFLDVSRGGDSFLETIRGSR